MALPRNGLVTLTWGNASGIDREKGLIVIKPSGVSYETLHPEDMSVVDMEGRHIEGGKPSSDTPTHLVLYQSFPGIGGVVHTHSRWATVFAQARLAIQPLGTTHADTFYGPVPCTRRLTKKEINIDYEVNTGKVIVETLENTDPLAVPAALVASHGPFTWGPDAAKAAENAIILEEVAAMAWQNVLLTEGSIKPIPQTLLDKHYLRKHGKDAYYGQ
ncbi:MAG: L-ribulose-5-phosphate 4-epimerase [Clostridia bacterium]|nr:L-ribulose-5-phosphate 4-epimerase [Clostridia bacterium]